MRPRFVINKGIKKVITAISKRFEEETFYTAAIYNPKDTTTKITCTAECAIVDGKNKVVFEFPGVDTDKLKVGFGTIEIYDTDKNIMIYRDDFAVIRKNSLPITDKSEPSES